MKVREKIYREHNLYQNFNALPPDMQGWASTRPVFEEVINTLRPNLIVEIGTWKGGSAFHMMDLALQHHKNVEMICIDTWLGSVEHWTGMFPSIQPLLRNGRPILFEQFISNVIHRGYQDFITPLPVDSINGYSILKSLELNIDLIYIDAAHDYYSAKLDFFLYSQLLRNGGYLIGDDFFHEPIKHAAIETFGENNIKPHGEDKFIWIK
jgi:predicted O-methyltransferase YrrM